MTQKKPEWLKIRFQRNEEMAGVEELVEKLALHTVCQEANCPNRIECFSKKTATFLILGSVCTRNCTFCNVDKGCPLPADPEEPKRVAQGIKTLQLKHAVITSVTRDDLPDGGADCFARVVREIKKEDSNVTVEVLIPDFQGNLSALEQVVRAGPDIISHNIETVPRLYPAVRPMAVYGRSLALLREVKMMDNRILTKSGIMVGLGEEEAEVLDVMKDLREYGCDLLTVGQYLAPSKGHHPVVEYIHPDVFEKYKEEALKMGFAHVSSAPFVRSSYHAGDIPSISHLR